MLCWQTPCVALTRGGMPIPDTLYALAGDAALAYQVFGSGEHRVVFVPGAFSNVELLWEWAPRALSLARQGGVMCSRSCALAGTPR
jgi:hypothetical protein